MAYVFNVSQNSNQKFLMFLTYYCSGNGSREVPNNPNGG